MSYRENPVSVAVRRIATDPAALARLGFRPYGQSIVARNPYDDEPRRTKKRAPLVGTVLVGLSSGEGRKPKRKFTPAQVRSAVMKKFPVGGSVLVMLGWWDAMKEDSVRVIVENTGAGLSDSAFALRFRAMAGAFTDRFLQNQVWVDFNRGLRLVGSRKMIWHK